MIDDPALEALILPAMTPIPTTDQTTMVTDPAQIPNELFGSIAVHLHEDKHTLLALALTSKVWCAESQRLLFRTVLDNGKNLGSIRDTHYLFLNAVIQNPILGSYVHTYSQHRLILHPINRTKSPFSEVASDLWMLTEAVLPTLINLKHLCIDPLLDNDQGATPLLEFKGCTFSLRSLLWGFRPFNDTLVGYWVEFLRTQHELVHLEVGGMFSYLEDFSWLTDDACPNLRSALCWLPSSIVHWPKIIGLRTGWFDESRPDETQVAALRRLKYLGVPTDLTVISALGGTDCNLVLIEISRWEFKRDRLLPDFPNLRVLVFTNIHVPWGVNVVDMEDAKRQMTVESFRRYPMLEYIVMEDQPGYDGRRYRKLTVPSSVGGSLDTMPDIRDEEFTMEGEQVGKSWWSAYSL